MSLNAYSLMRKVCFYIPVTSLVSPNLLPLDGTYRWYKDELKKNNPTFFQLVTSITRLLARVRVKNL